MFDEVGDHVEGEMSIPGKPKKNTGGLPEFNTLDEPIRDTVVSLELSCFCDSCFSCHYVVILIDARFESSGNQIFACAFSQGENKSFKRMYVH